MVGEQPRIDESNPSDTFAALRDDAGAGRAALVDCRTEAEWRMIGAPDLSGLGVTPIFEEWLTAPDMAHNPDFVPRVAAALGAAPLERVYVICRSGARSHQAALALADHFDRSGQTVTCVNVVEGFEGDPDAAGRRGTVNGWQARGLPWRRD